MPEEEISEYERDLSIDEKALDVEWLEHPSRMFKYCRTQAQAHRDLDYAKESLNLVKARLDLDIRRSPELYDVVKVSEGSVSAAILMHSDYQVANNIVREAQYQHDVIRGVVTSFDHRKSALEALVKLHGQQYFAGPSVPHNLSEERAQRDTRVQQKIHMRRRPADG